MRQCILECDLQQYIYPRSRADIQKHADNVKSINFSFTQIKATGERILYIENQEQENRTPNAILQSFRNECSERSQENEPSNAPPLAP